MKVLSLFFSIALASPTFAQCITEATSRFSEPDCANHDFGNAIALDGDRLVVGEWLDNSGGISDEGTAYVLRRTGTQWELEQQLDPLDSVTTTRFGVDVAIDGDRVVVGATRVPNRGAAYVFERTGTTWTRTAKLTDPTGLAVTNFGTSIDIDGDWIMVGEPRDGTSGPDSGSVHFFHYDGANWNSEFVDIGTVPGVRIGNSVAMDGDRAVTGGAQPGIIIYRRTGTTWEREQELAGPASSIDIDGDRFVAGARFDDRQDTNAGWATVYRRDGTTWSIEQHIVAAGAYTSSLYGTSIGIRGDHVAVGTREFNLLRRGVGYLFAFDGTEWKEERKFLDTSMRGDSCAVGDGFVVFGSLAGDCVGGFNGGSIAEFDIDAPLEAGCPETFCEGDGGDQLGCTPCPCGNESVPGARGGCANSTGFGARLWGIGSTSVSDEQLFFSLERIEGGSFAFLTSGSSRLPGDPSNPCFGLDSGVVSQTTSLDGLRCIAGGVIRHGARGASSLGNIGLGNTGWGAPLPAGGFSTQSGFVAGEMRHFQAFYRDSTTAQCQSRQNTSNGVTVTFQP